MNKKFFYAEIAAIGIFLTPLIYLQDPPQYGVDIFRNFLMFFFTKTLPLIVICLSMLRLIRTTMQRITFPFLGTVVASVLWTFLIFIWYGVRHAGPIAIFMLSIPFNLAFLLIFSIIDRFYETKFARILTHVIFTVSATWFVYLTYGNITVAIPERNRVAGIKQHALQILNEMNALCGSDTVCRFAIVQRENDRDLCGYMYDETAQKNCEASSIPSQSELYYNKRIDDAIAKQRAKTRR